MMQDITYHMLRYFSRPATSHMCSLFFTCPATTLLTCLNTSHMCPIFLTFPASFSHVPHPRMSRIIWYTFYQDQLCKMQCCFWCGQLYHPQSRPLKLSWIFKAILFIEECYLNRPNLNLLFNFSFTCCNILCWYIILSVLCARHIL